MTTSLQIVYNFAFYFTFLLIEVNICGENSGANLIIRHTTTMYRPEKGQPPCIFYLVFLCTCLSFRHEQ